MKTLKTTKRRISKKPMCIRSLVLYLLLYGMLMFGLMGCSAETRDWRAAQEANNIEALEEYLENYPDGKFSEDAHILIEDLIFAGAEEQDDIAGYEKYLTLYPEGRFRQDADERIEALHFADAQEQNNLAAYEGYLSLYPKGIFRQDAEERMDALHFAAAQEQDNVAAYEEYLFLYPEGMFRQDAEDAINSLTGKLTGTIVDKSTGKKLKGKVNLIPVKAKDDGSFYWNSDLIQDRMRSINVESGDFLFSKVKPGHYYITINLGGGLPMAVVSEMGDRLIIQIEAGKAFDMEEVLVEM